MLILTFPKIFALLRKSVALHLKGLTNILLLEAMIW